MPSLRGIARRVRGEHVDAIARDVAEIRELLLGVNHVVTTTDSRIVGDIARSFTDLARSLAEVRTALDQLDESVAEQRTVLLELNHDVRSGAEEGLPLFLGYAERLRLDADTAIGAVQVIERQLALLQQAVAAARGPDPG